VRRLAVVALCASLALAACNSGDEPKSATVHPQVNHLAKAPGALGALYKQGNELLDGGAGAYKARLKQLRGHPVVVNKWASWCGPCRYEFPFYQRQAVKRGKRIAFLGVNSDDPGDGGRQFLDENPVPFPSYKDPRLAVAASFNAVQATPATAFYDSQGKLAFVHQGSYASEAKLAQDIERYAR
jgi:cytochrome c biogenesis protein CcmG/thiol:disulfide interchange protein DsbE